MPDTTPTLQWTAKVGDASAFCVWGSRAFVRDLSADKLSSRAVPCVFLGFPPDAPGWQFYHPTSRRVLSFQDVTFDESVPYYRLFPYRTAPLPPPPLFLAPGPPPLLTVVLLGVLSLRVPGLGVLSLSVRSLGVQSLRVLSLGVLSLGFLILGVLILRELSLKVPQVLHPNGSHSLHSSGASGLVGAGALLLELKVLRALEVLLLLVVLGVLEPPVPEVLVLELLPGMVVLLELELLEGLELAMLLEQVLLEALELALLELLAGAPGGAGVGATGAAGGAGGAGGAAGVGANAGGAGAFPAGSGGAARPRPYFVPLLEQVIGLSPSTGLAPSLECSPPIQSQSQLLPASPMPASSPYTSPTRACPFAVSSSALADLESDSLRAASPTVMRLLATIVTDPSFEFTAASALVAELVDLAAHCRLDYAASLVAEFESVCPPSVGGECALGTDVLEDRQEEF
ncbi:unnamed protein product [Closterium sp. NIES-64]|nr:unnamed protein product [Closterium sp. NIES-64]